MHLCRTGAQTILIVYSPSPVQRLVFFSSSPVSFFFGLFLLNKMNKILNKCLSQSSNVHPGFIRVS